MNPALTIAGVKFASRLIVGTGKYRDGVQTKEAVEASGAELVTLAVRRVNLDRSRESLLDFLDTSRLRLLPNTAGCYSADEAIRAARLAREVGLSDWVKVEVIGDVSTLYPDVQATVEATRVLVREGFTVLPYTSDDIVVAKRLIDVGASAVMPLGAPIGSGIGIANETSLRVMRELITEVPLIVDAGLGTLNCAPQRYILSKFPSAALWCRSACSSVSARGGAPTMDTSGTCSANAPATPQSALNSPTP
jgi:thiazole synthase